MRSRSSCADSPDADVVLVESGGDNLTLTFSGALADYFIFVIDVAEGDKIPRKWGPGITASDLLVIKDRPRPVRAGRPGSHGSRRPRLRGQRPSVFTNCFTREGLEEVADRICQVIDQRLPSPTSGST
jgi:urease accessory protein